LIVGIDPSEVGINIARNNSPEIIFHNISIYDFEQKELYGKFDIITSIEVIEHLNYVSVFLKQVKKYLRPDGYFLLTTPYHGYIKNLVLSVFNLWDRHFSVRNEVGHLRFFSVKSLSGMLKDAGLSNIKLYFSGRCLYLWKSMICLCQNKA
jgi:SAM-dependent methyltransferase